MKRILPIFVLIVSCSTTPDHEPAPAVQVDKQKVLAAIDSWEEPELTEEGYIKDIMPDCDGALWQGKWCAATGCDLSVKYEDKETKGRYYRRGTEDKCWKDGQENGSKTTWSRDMFICGLIPWGLATENLAALDRHARYGWDKNWVMGEPPLFDDLVDNSRLYYTPSTRAVLYKAIRHLGGELYPGVAWDWVVSNFEKLDMSKGLDDYQAHLQICKIWATSEIDGGISSIMKERIKEHHDRLPDDPFYAVMYGRYYGDWEPALKSCTAEKPFEGDYVRCGHSTPACAYAHSVFSCDLLIKWSQSP